MDVETVLTRFSIGAGATVAAFLTMVGLTITAIGGTAFVTTNQTAIGWRVASFAIAMVFARRALSRASATALAR